MIYIEKGDETFLPEKFHKRHNICVVLYDLMLDVGKDDAFKDLLSTNFPLTKEEKGEFAAAEKEGIEGVLEYLSKNGRKDAVVLALSKNVFNAVLADFLSFIYESLSNARNGKMSIAFNLLRKPLTDELLILEQLLLDRNEFIDRFQFKGDPNLYDPSSGAIGPDKLRTIINLSAKKLGFLSALFTDSVFSFRYSKTEAAGLNGIMNQAHHLVTSNKGYKTNDRSFNFIFSGGDDLDGYWDYYYQTLPYLLAYSSSIVDLLAHELVGLPENLRALRNLKRYLSLAYWTVDIPSNRHDEKTKMIDFLLIPDVKCGSCKTSTSIIEADFKLFYESGLFLCPKCLSALLQTSDLPKKISSFFNDLDQELVTISNPLMTPASEPSISNAPKSLL
jgi:hypothetical protein